jgi:hypothetical protein
MFCLTIVISNQTCFIACLDYFEYDVNMRRRKKKTKSSCEVPLNHKEEKEKTTVRHSITRCASETFKEPSISVDEFLSSASHL